MKSQVGRMKKKTPRKNKDKKFLYLTLAVFAFLLAIRMYPAVLNEYPKGSYSWYHMERSRDLAGGNLFYDTRNAGGTISSYPPLFLAVISPIFYLGEPLESAKLLAPIIGFIAVL